MPSSRLVSKKQKNVFISTLVSKLYNETSQNISCMKCCGHFLYRRYNNSSHFLNTYLSHRLQKSNMDKKLYSPAVRQLISFFRCYIEGYGFIITKLKSVYLVFNRFSTFIELSLTRGSHANADPPPPRIPQHCLDYTNVVSNSLLYTSGLNSPPF